MFGVVVLLFGSCSRLLLWDRDVQRGAAGTAHAVVVVAAAAHGGLTVVTADGLSSQPAGNAPISVAGGTLDHVRLARVALHDAASVAR